MAPASTLDRSATAPWTRPANELVVGYGLFTAAESPLMARRHMLTYGTTPEQMAAAAAVIRTNGHANPEAVYAGRGPFAPADILASRMVADPFHLLDCATTSEGGCALVLTTRSARVTARRPCGFSAAPAMPSGLPTSSPRSGTFSLAPTLPGRPRGRPGGERRLRHGRPLTGDVDVAELYDPFSFEIIRQLEAFGFCAPGDGGPFVEDGNIGPGSTLPVTTDGGTMSFSHPGINAQQLQRVIRGVQQLRGSCPTNQVQGAEVALCSNGGSGALFCDVLLLGPERP